jgi:hypothetical protein
MTSDAPNKVVRARAYPREIVCNHEGRGHKGIAVAGRWAFGDVEPEFDAAVEMIGFARSAAWFVRIFSSME